MDRAYVRNRAAIEIAKVVPDARLDFCTIVRRPVLRASFALHPVSGNLLERVRSIEDALTLLGALCFGEMLTTGKTLACAVGKFACLRETYSRPFTNRVRLRLSTEPITQLPAKHTTCRRVEVEIFSVSKTLSLTRRCIPNLAICQ